MELLEKKKRAAAIAVSPENGGPSLLVIFYVEKRIPFNHAIWHGFVLAGCVCHFFAIYFFVRPI